MLTHSYISSSRSFHCCSRSLSYFSSNDAKPIGIASLVCGGLFSDSPNNPKGSWLAELGVVASALAAISSSKSFLYESTVLVALESTTGKGRYGRLLGFSFDLVLSLFSKSC